MKKEELRIALNKVCEKLNADEQNVKVWETEFQQAIERTYPGKCWWNVTGCNIFLHLLEFQNPRLTLEQILMDYKLET